MGYLWPPRWWPLTSLSPLRGGRVEESEGKLCDRCEREPYLGRLLNVGNRQMVCVDCFAFVTGIDDRDPIEDPTARSGDPRYVASSERADASVQAILDRHGEQRLDPEEFEREFGSLPKGDERPPLAPLPKGTPWWVRVLHWLGVEWAKTR